MLVSLLTSGALNFALVPRNVDVCGSNTNSSLLSVTGFVVHACGLFGYALRLGALRCLWFQLNVDVWFCSRIREAAVNDFAYSVS